MLPVLLALLAACRDDVEGACQDYVDAYTDCVNTAYVGDPATASSILEAGASYCEPYDAGDYEGTDREVAKALRCYAKTIERGDCSDPEAYSVTASSLLEECAEDDGD